MDVIGTTEIEDIVIARGNVGEHVGFVFCYQFLTYCF